MAWSSAALLPDPTPQAKGAIARGRGQRRFVGSALAALAASAASAALTLVAAPALVLAQPAQVAQADAGPAEAAQRELDRLHRLKDAAEAQGNMAEAVALADRELALLGGDPGVPGDTGISLAQTYISYGDCARAEPLLLRMLAARGAADDEDLEIGRIYLALGDVYLAVNDLARAGELLQRAGRSFARSDASGVLRFLTFDALARVYQEQGALGAFEEALGAMRAVLDERPDMAPVNRALPDLRAAGLALRHGHTDVAARLLDGARGQMEPALPAVHPWRAELLELRGVLLARRRDAGAEPLLLRALVIRERLFAPYHPAILQTLGDLATVYLQQGRVADAARTRERAAALRDQADRITLARGSERQKRLYMALSQRDTDATVSLHLQGAPQSQAAARLALRTVLRRKGLVLDAIAESFVTVRRQLDDEGRALFDAVAQLDGRLSALVSRGPIDIPLEEHLRVVAQLEGERQALEARLAARAQALPGGAPEAPVTVERVQAAIPEGAALVEIVQYRPHRPFGPPVTPTWGRPRYAAYVLARDGNQVAGVDLGDAAALDAVAAKLAVELADPGRDPRGDARTLDAWVMQPVRARLGGARQVLLSPDGALNLVPFAALVDEDGRDLIERASFTYLASGRDLLRARAAADPGGAGAALVFADPAFGDGAAAEGDGPDGRGLRSADLAAARFSRLSGTGSEAKAVKRAFGGATVLTGAAATEEALKAAHRPRLLHIATHGFFLPDQAAGDAGAGAGATNVRGGAAGNPKGAPTWSENPLLRSGLALAGANARRSTSDRDDGIVTALEISGLDLRGTQLVVLSACETGLGEVLRGDGVSGLRRALGFAGAETAVISLWSVGDAATRDLMAAYYAALARGGGRSEAMREAQLQIRRGRPHPSAWAAFIVSGDGAALDGRQVAPTFPRLAPGPRGCACVAGDDGDDGDDGDGGDRRARAGLAAGAGLLLGLAARRAARRLRSSPGAN